MTQCKHEELSGGLGFMGSPRYFEAKERIDNYFTNKKKYDQICRWRFNRISKRKTI